MNSPMFSSLRSKPEPVGPKSSEPSDDLDAGELDLRSIAGIIWRGKWIIAVATLIGAILAYLLVSQQVSFYKATAKVMFGIQQANVINLQDVLGEQSVDTGRLEDQIQILSSTSLTERVIDELDLDRNPGFNPSLRAPVVTFWERVGNTLPIPPEVTDFFRNTGIIRPAPPEPSEEEMTRRERLAVIRNVQRGLRLQPIGTSRVLEVTYYSTSPAVAAAISNAIAEQYIVDQLEAKLDATRSATDWLSTRVDDLRVQLQQNEEALETARAKVAETSGQTLEVTQQQLSSLNGALSSQRSQVTRLQALFDRLNQAVEEGDDLGAISEFRASNVIQQFRAQLTQLRNDLANLPDSIAEDHPARVGLRQQTDQLNEDILLEARNIIQAARSDLTAARAEEASLQDEVRRLEELAQLQSLGQVRIRQLEREAEASRALYQTFLARLQETTQQQDLQEADARILSRAEQPLYPETVSKRRTAIIIIAFSAIVGIGIVLLIDFLNNTFRSPNQLETLTKQRVLATIPSGKNRARRRQLLHALLDRPSSSLAEAIRNLRTSILFSNVDNPPKVVMFTSSIPKEAKSSTAMLVGVTSKQMGKSAIVVDCDLRLPSLMGIFEPPADHPDLLDVIEGTADLRDAIYVEPETGLHLLLSGYKKVNDSISAADILASQKFGAIIAELAAHYELVILDTPPALVVTDARIVSRHADAVVYAVRWDETPRAAVIEGLKELRSVDAPLIGVVMTMVNEGRAAKYAYDGYQYYKGKYRGYYSN
ncbi:GumC family protein [Sulfitobacter sp. JB4-11]|uniref:GumC family protein n=1 Tax=Sulfitobacter rhodophyticola TaxID=3238304 RepID=UPI003D81B4F7